MLTYSRLVSRIKAARKSVPADLCIRQVKVVNVFSGEIEVADVAIHDGCIIGWGDYEAKENILAEGMYMAPGFIDGHIHIESSMLSPAQFCAAVLPWGTTGVVADPHEIANVLGIPGIQYFLDAARHLPLDFYFMLPSCVPATTLETSGAELRAPDLYHMSHDPRVLGLGEMMNFPGVITTDPAVIDKLMLFEEYNRDGHAPQLSGTDLNAYLVSGIDSDHECTTFAEAREKLAKGMYIMIRQGSQSKDMPALLPLVNEHNWPRFLFVSDDLHPDDLLHKGHMNNIVNQAMELGMDPIRAITLASWTPAQAFNLSRLGLGAIAPGYQADFTLSPTLRPWIPVRVFKCGREVAKDGQLLEDPRQWLVPNPPSNPMHIRKLGVEDLRVLPSQGMLRVIGVREGSLITDKLLVEPPIENGCVITDTKRDILKLIVVNRYDKGDQAHPLAVAFAKGFGLKNGAIASTVAHDSHNLIAVGVTDEALLCAVETIRKIGGGMCVTLDDRVLETLSLPLAGLMADREVGEVATKLESLKQQAAALGCRLSNPFMALSFLALPVIPELKLTDRGLVDVGEFTIVSLFE